MITERQKTLVQQSWAEVAPISEAAAELFYRRLFELDPSLQTLFAHASMKEQGKKLTQMITVAVKGLDNLGAIVPAIEALGRRHVGYGVQDSHYDTVGEALLWTLEEGLGERFTPETAAAWATTYDLLAGTMKAAAKVAAA
jgi:hemoglobin-like flavoprotein